MKKVRDIPKNERPRERLCQKGAQFLTDSELLAILLGSGTPKHDVLTIADKILKIVDAAKGNPAIEDLRKINGVGVAKATVISAALEFSRRRIKPEGLKITFPADVLPLIQHYADRKQEHFICISLNGSNEVMAVRVIFVGFVNKTQVHPREVFADAITDRASAVVVAHNHPSGGLEPSKEDVEFTKQLKSAGEILGIKLLDHIIFNQKGYYSFTEKKEI